MNQLKVGALLSYVNMALHILIGLVYVPLLLHYLSVEEYGLYQLIGSLVAYLSVMDFGLSGTITRYYSQRLALNDEKGQENVLAIAMIIYLGIGVLIILAGIVLYQLLDSIYGATLSSHEMSSAKAMMVLLIMNVALTIPSHVFTSAITSHEQFVFLRLVTIIRSIMNPIIVFAVLQFKAEALSVVQVQVVLNVIVILCNIWYARHKIHIKIHLHSFDSVLVKSMFAFAFFVFLSAIVDQVYWKTGQLILGAVSGTAAVAVLSVALQLERYYAQFSTVFYQVLFPKIAKISAISDSMEELSKLFRHVGRLQFVILGLIMTGFVLFGKIFLILWVGERFSDAYIMVLLIMLPQTIPLIQNTGVVILQAKNKHAYRSIVYVFMAVLNVVLSVLFLRKFGGIGSAAILGLCKFIGDGLVMNWYYWKRLKIDIKGFYIDIFQLSIPVIISLVIGWIALSLISISSWAMLFLGIIMYSIVYSVMVFGIGLHPNEKKQITSIIGKIIR